MSVIAIDIGSSSCRIMIVDGTAVCEYARFPVEPTLIDGLLRWNVDDLFGKVQATIDRAIDEFDVTSIGICSWGVDYGVIRNGKLIDMPICYRDERNDKQFLHFHETYAERALYLHSGITPLPFNTVYQLLADKVEGRYGADVKILMIADLLAYALTGESFVEATNASTTGLLALDGLSWNFPLIAELGIDCDIFPPIIQAGERYGVYRGKPIIACCTHDTASAIFAMDVEEGETYLSSGSWLLLGKLLDEPLITNETFENRYTNERGYANGVTFLNNINGLFPIQRLIKQLGISYREVDETVESGVFLGKLDVNRLNRPDDMRGQTLRELGLTSARDIDLIKTVYDNLAMHLAEKLKQLDRITGKTTHRIKITGGMTKAPYLMKKAEECCGVSFTVCAGEGAVGGIVKVLSLK